MHFMSNVWLRAHFPPKQFVIWWKISIFVTKSWFLAISRLFSFPTILICKKWSKYNFTATAKFRQSRFCHSNTPKHAKKRLFLGIFLFILFLRTFFLRTMNPKSAFLFIKCVMKYPKWPIYATSVQKNGSFKFD